MTIGVSQEARPYGIGRWIVLCGRLLRSRRDHHGRHLSARGAEQHCPARHRHHQAQHLGRRAAIGARPCSSASPRSATAATRARSFGRAQLVRDRAAEPLHPPVADLFPVGRHRRRLARGARRDARPRVARRAVPRRRSLRGPAVLLREEGMRMASELAGDDPPRAAKPRADEPELRLAAEQLRALRLLSPRRPRFCGHGRLARAIPKLRQSARRAPRQAGSDPRPPEQAAAPSRSTSFRSHASASPTIVSMSSCAGRQSSVSSIRALAATSARRVAGAAAFHHPLDRRAVARSTASSTSSTDSPRP